MSAPPRLKSGLWVEAYLRRSAVAGINGAIIHKGDADAGSVFVVLNRLDGRHDLLGPAPGAAYDDNGDRRFTKMLSDAAWLDVSAAFAKRRSSDPDLWLLEVELREGLAGLQQVEE